MNFFVMTLAIMVILIVAPCRGNPIGRETVKSPQNDAMEHSLDQIEILDGPNTKQFLERQGNAISHSKIFTSPVNYFTVFN